MWRCPLNVKQMMYFEGKGYYILDYKRGDVNGDRVYEDIYLLGDKPYGEESQFCDNIILVIYDAERQAFYKIPFKSNAGYNPGLFLGDFTGDKIKDILITIDTGGSGGLIYTYIYSFVENKSRLIFDYESFNESSNYEVKYMDYFKVEVKDNNLNKKYIIDISLKPQDYLSEIYDENGKLKLPLFGGVNPLDGLYPVDFDRNGVLELLAFQRIFGRYNADTLGYIQNYLRWENNRFIVYNQNISIEGSEEPPVI